MPCDENWKEQFTSALVIKKGECREATLRSFIGEVPKISKRGVSPSTRRKLTVTVDKSVLDEAKKLSAEKRIPISRLIENFLEFFANPEVYCFKCGERFSARESELCAKCGWMICPECKVCRCGLDEDTAVAVFHMRRVYEDLLSGRVKG